ncbi:ThiF family adenylyltransferase (plasmid) [Halobacterium salinarum]|uniref:HesA/MoeB/ThiF family protein n=1 Tax=Halobacterium salinarum TaxID=2242 RepID=UPI0030CF5D59
MLLDALPAVIHGRSDIRRGQPVVVPLRDATFDAAADDRYLDDRAVILAHSHPFSHSPAYSSLDDDSEPMAFVGLTAEGSGPHASLLFGADDSITGRVWPAEVGEIRAEGAPATAPIDEVVIVAEDRLQRIQTTDSRLPDPNGRSRMHDRQALVHSGDGNAALRDAHVAVVGAGGLGSLIVQSLAHLGVGELTVVDPDVVEETNRSRIVGARPTDAGAAEATPDASGVIPAAWAEASPDIGRPKVEVMQRLVANIDPSIRFHGIARGVESEAGMSGVLKADVIVSATDTASSRVALSHAAKQYHRPLFDVGTNINVVDDTAKYIATRLSIVTPESPCLDCQDEINWERVTAEQKAPEELEYGMDLVEGEAPAVITVNQQAAARVNFALHRYLTGLLADRGEFKTGVSELITGFHDEGGGELDPACKFCNGEFAGIGDRGPASAKPRPRKAPDGTGLVPELGLEATPEGQRRRRRQSNAKEMAVGGMVEQLRRWIAQRLP